MGVLVGHKLSLKRNGIQKRLNFWKYVIQWVSPRYLALTGCLMPEVRLVLRAVAIDAVLWGI